MKQWKRELVDAIIAEFDKHEEHFVPEIGMDTDRWVKFSDVAKKLGYQKVLAIDIREISPGSSIRSAQSFTECESQRLRSQIALRAYGIRCSSRMLNLNRRRNK